MDRLEELARATVNEQTLQVPWFRDLIEGTGRADVIGAPVRWAIMVATSTIAERLGSEALAERGRREAEYQLRRARFAEFSTELAGPVHGIWAGDQTLAIMTSAAHLWAVSLDGTRLRKGSLEGTVRRLVVPDGVEIRACAVGGHFVAAVDSRDRVWCWPLASVANSTAVEQGRAVAALTAVEPAYATAQPGIAEIALNDSVLWCIDKRGDLWRAELGGPDHGGPATISCEIVAQTPVALFAPARGVAAGAGFVVVLERSGRIDYQRDGVAEGSRVSPTRDWPSLRRLTAAGNEVMGAAVFCDASSAGAVFADVGGRVWWWPTQDLGGVGAQRVHLDPEVRLSTPRLLTAGPEPLIAALDVNHRLLTITKGPGGWVATRGTGGARDDGHEEVAGLCASRDCVFVVTAAGRLLAYRPIAGEPRRLRRIRSFRARYCAEDELADAEAALPHCVSLELGAGEHAEQERVDAPPVGGESAGPNHPQAGKG